MVDPGLEGDPWAEKPWLEGRVLSSVNVLGAGDTNHVGQGKDEKGSVLEESFGEAIGHLGKDGDGEEIPKESAGRMKFFLTKKRREEVVFKKDEKYFLDFYNPYIDFNGEFACRFPYRYQTIYYEHITNRFTKTPQNFLSNYLAFRSRFSNTGMDNLCVMSSRIESRKMSTLSFSLHSWRGLMVKYPRMKKTMKRMKTL